MARVTTKARKRRADHPGALLYPNKMAHTPQRQFAPKKDGWWSEPRPDLPAPCTPAPHVAAVGRGSRQFREARAKHGHYTVL